MPELADINEPHRRQNPRKACTRARAHKAEHGMSGLEGSLVWVSTNRPGQASALPSIPLHYVYVSLPALALLSFAFLSLPLPAFPLRCFALLFFALALLCSASPGFLRGRFLEAGSQEPGALSPVLRFVSFFDLSTLPTFFACSKPFVAVGSRGPVPLANMPSHLGHRAGGS